MDPREESPKRKVLLVEDDVFMLDLVSQELAGAGFHVIVAKNGAEAVAQFLQTKPDLILLDLLLPDQNGYDALRTIRTHPGGADVKVMVLSNLSETTNIEEGKKLGVLDYLVKANHTLPEIVQKVQSVLGLER
ncbi:MAG: hypothetical protein G01um101466_41 [Parcubacteria group bacterium Gr01-1014_66]|nr:MAG: hypothetical protein G01um101466_41 [Parcubacteria group bacterium Gr01-1014_66]